MAIDVDMAIDTIRYMAKLIASYAQALESWLLVVKQLLSCMGWYPELLRVFRNIIP